MKKTEVTLQNKLPRQVSRPDSSVLIYDAKLASVSAEFRSWLKRYPRRVPVRAGEQLKDIEKFPALLRRLTKASEGVPARALTVVAVGGGSVGDAAGFFASVYKRGVRLIHVPSTWLAAIDSSHGGKTALNVGGTKNQIGTFYPADEVVLVKSLLFSQPEARAQDALAELAKIALIDGGAWTSALRSSRLTSSGRLWKFLKPAIEAKMKIVRRDPEERSGLRQLLNFGHTWGHVIESELGWSHGRAVAQGLFFALELSESLGVAAANETEKSISFLASLGLKPEFASRPLPRARAEMLLRRDKKRDLAGRVTFIVSRRMGRAERFDVPIARVLDEAARLGWVKAR